jgi:hypothetical protein
MRQWKVGERIIARLLGCERIPLTGRARGKAHTDLVSNWLAVEVKTRKRLPIFLEDAMDSAERGMYYANAKDEKIRLPIVVIHADHADYRRSLVVMRLGDADDYFGLCRDSAEKEEPPDSTASVGAAR